MTAPVEDVASLFAGRYRLLRTIGEGSAATVYLARDARAQRLVALKVFHALRLGHPLASERLGRAASLWRQVRHPNVVALYDHGRTAAPGHAGHDGEVHYLAMQHVPGRPLSWYVRTRGPLGVAEGVAIAQQILAALAAAHAVGLTHQDLRPQNVLLAPDGVVKVADFGLAEAVGYSSPHYLSPEQAQARPALPASDLYALGVILYEMLADAVPFDSTVPQIVLLKHAGEAPPPPRRLRPTLPTGIQDVILRALAKHPDDRWPSPAEMSAALEPYAETAPRPAGGHPASRWSAMLAVREQDLAPTPARGPGALRRLRLTRSACVRLAAVAMVLALIVGYSAGWRVRVSAPATGPPVAETSEAPLTPAPVAGPSPAAPLATTTALSQAGGRAGSPSADCTAPDHPNPAIAEAYRAMAEDACGTAGWETVAEALSTATARKVKVGFGQPGRGVYGFFDPAASQVTLAQVVANEAPRARAAVLLHEFTHVRDYYAGGLRWDDDLLACYDVEYRAFRAEAGFWRASQARRGNPEPTSALESDLDYITRAVDRGSADFIARDLVNRYGASCKIGTRG